MQRVAVFVDGSNLNGSLADMQVNVDDYAAFFKCIVKQAVEDWNASLWSSGRLDAYLLRVYWYVLASMDEWDLDNEKSRTALRDLFDRGKDLRTAYVKVAGEALAARPAEQRTQEAIVSEAWSRCFADISEWYQRSRDRLESFRRFYHGVRRSTDFIDLIEAGHWHVDMMDRRLSEKGLDASLAVGMVTLADQYDVALVISGDADMLPSIRWCKDAGKHVGVVEFLRGHPPEDRGRGFSSRLRLEADFVTRVYEMDLVRNGIARKRDAVPPAS